MTQMVSEVYHALKSIGMDEEHARRMAEIVLSRDADIVTTPVLRAELAALRTEMAKQTSELIKWNVGTLVAMTGVFAAIVKLL